MSDPPFDIDAARLANTLQSVNLSSTQQEGESNSTTEGADLAAENAFHGRLDEPVMSSRHLFNRGFEFPAPTTEVLDERYDVEADLGRYGDDAIVRRLEILRGASGRVIRRLEITAAPRFENPNVEDTLADGQSGAEDDLDEEGYWEQPDQANDASVHDWRLDPFVGCNICFEQKSVEDVWEAPCNHIHCNVCLEILVRSWYTSTRAPKCCDAVLAWEDLKHQIDPELVAAIDAKREELDSNNRIYCSERTCSTFIGAQDISGDTATCSACQKQTCTSCKATSHTGGCVPDASISNELEHAEQEGWKRCGQCQMVVERVDGCPHMTCLCGYEFCYDCEGPYRMCNCQEIEQQQYLEYHNQYEEEEETVRPPLPPWDRDYTMHDHPADTDTQAQPAPWDTNEVPAEEAAVEVSEEMDEEVDTAGTMTEDGVVFGPLSEERLKRIDHIREINDHYTLGHGRPVNRGTGSGQCEYCEDYMWRYILRCPDCGMRLCRMCSDYVHRRR